MQRALPVLNDRQRAYLLAIFSVDQELEAEMRSLPFQPFQPRPKASEWRWMEYSEPVPEIQKPASQLYEAIRKSAPIDQGTGAKQEWIRYHELYPDVEPPRPTNATVPR